MTTTVACNSNSLRKGARKRKIRKRATPSNINHVKASLGDENLFERLSLGTANMKQQATKSLVLRMEWEKKRRPSRKCLHLYMLLLSEAFNENAIAKRSFFRLQVETHYNWAMYLVAAKVHNATMLWKAIDQSLLCCCFATASPPKNLPQT